MLKEWSALIPIIDQKLSHCPLIEEYVIKKIIDAGFNRFKFLSTNNKNGEPYSITERNFREKVNNHLRYIANWSNSILFEDLRNAKEVSAVYVNLDYNLTPIRLESENCISLETISLSNIFDNLSKHLVIVGQPGAGKTTTMKMICQKVLFDETFYPDRFQIPILIRLREISNDLNLYNQLFKALGYENHDKNGDRKIYDEDFLRDRIVETLNSISPIKVLLVLEGFDEIPSPDARIKTLKEFEYLCLNIDESTIILTSRSSDYRKSTPNTQLFEIAPLNIEQIKKFTYKYLPKDSAQDLYQKVVDSPFADTAMRPLTLAHLCALYERYGDIPDKPKTLYRKIVSLLVEDWDVQRGIHRPSKFSNFNKERILEYLYSFAFELTIKGSTIFGSQEISEIYNKLYLRFGLPENEYASVLTEIESHNGLFIESSFKRYEFSHKSIQEYLTAEYLVHLGYIPKRIELLRKIPNELAIAVSISSNPNSYFAQVICGPVYQSTLSLFEFLRIFTSRLSLEKPDFNCDQFLGMALLCLIEKADDSNIISFVDSSIFRSCMLQLASNLEIDNAQDRDHITIKIIQPVYNELDMDFPSDLKVPDSVYPILKEAQDSLKY